MLWVKYFYDVIVVLLTDLLNQKEHWKGSAGMGKTRDNIEVERGGLSHTGNFLQTGGAGSAIFWSGYVGAINGRVELISGGTYGFLTTCDRGKGKEEFKPEL